jgi:hypothetical protein
MHNLTKNMLIITCLLVTFQNSCHAATIIVDNNQDLAELDGNCDLRDAILSANVNFSVDGCTAGQVGVQDLIIVSVAGPIQLASTLPVFSSILITTTVNADPVEIIAAPNRRIMRVSPNSSNDNNFAMINFKMTGGHATDEDTGGAILFSGSTASLGVIELNGMIFENNQAYSGGALHFDETSADSLRIADNIFINNSASNIGGAVSGFRVVKPGGSTFIEVLSSHFENNTSDGSAGALFLRNEDVGSAILNDNHFIGNSATNNIGAVGLGAIVDTQFYEINRNLFLSNQAGNDSGALEVSFASIVQVRESLFAFNSAARGGAVTSSVDDALLRLSNSTLVHNAASIAGDNIYIFGTGRLLPARNIIAYPVNGDNCSGALGTTPPGSTSGNITDDNSCELLDTVTNTLIADPLLTGTSSQVDTYPGFMPTINSPALDSTEACADEDLMRRNRPEDGDDDGMAFCDVGAIETFENTDVLWSDSFGF